MFDRFTTLRSKGLNTPEWLFTTFTKDVCLAYNSEFKYISIDANILKSSIYLLSPLITTETADNRQFPFSSDLKQNEIILNNNRECTCAMVTLVTNFSRYETFLLILRFCKSVRLNQFSFSMTATLNWESRSIILSHEKTT